MTEMIEYTRESAQRLIEAYERAVEQGHDYFDFEGHTFYTGYAKYVTEYLRSRMRDK